METFTKVGLTVGQAAALRSMIKMEAVYRMGAGIKQAQDTNAKDEKLTTLILEHVVSNSSMWLDLDRPVASALYDLEVQGAAVTMETPINITVPSELLPIYHECVHSGVYVKAIDAAKDGKIEREHWLPLLLMSNQRDALLLAFPAVEAAPAEKVEAKPQGPLTFPVRGGGMLN